MPSLRARPARTSSTGACWRRSTRFRATVEDFRRAGGRGVNVTVPFKPQAFALAHRRSARALDAEAANVLEFVGDSIVADNTDGVGLLRDLEMNLQFPLVGRRILLMGAGGAAQGTLGLLLAARPASLVVGNRTAARARRLADRFVAAAAAASGPSCERAATRRSRARPSIW